MRVAPGDCPDQQLQHDGLSGRGHRECEATDPARGSDGDFEREHGCIGGGHRETFQARFADLGGLWQESWPAGDDRGGAGRGRGRSGFLAGRR